MPIRPLAIFDLPYLYSFREEAIGLDTARSLTRGSPLGAVGLMAYMNPARHIYSAIANGEKDSVLGGIIHSRDESFAKLLYLAPVSQLGHPDLPELIENLAVQAGAWGAFHILAEVNERSDAFVPLRRSGFSVYAWQRMWEVSQITGSASGIGGGYSVHRKFRAHSESAQLVVLANGPQRPLAYIFGITVVEKKMH